MGTRLVLEIDATTTDDGADAVLDDASEQHHLGVVVKGTQGTRWARANASELLVDAQGDGMQGAWLHYCEPQHNPPDQEASWLFQHLGALPLGLGIWLEVEEGQGVEGYMLNDWLKLLVDAISTPRRPAAVVLAPQLAMQLAGVTASTRTVLTAAQEAPIVNAWATRLDAPLELGRAGAVECYEVASVRSLVPVQLDAPEAPQDRSGAPALDGSGDGGGGDPGPGIMGAPAADPHTADPQADPQAA